MKVGIIGSGDVAKRLGGGFLKHGYEVMLGSRDLSKLADWKKENPTGKTGSFREAAEYAQLGVLAVKGAVALEALKEAGAENLKGKPVIDVTNPIADSAPTNGVLKYFTNLDESLHERIQKNYPNISFVKAFNSVGNAFMVDPHFDDGKPTMFICGNDAEAKKIVSQVLDKFGWDVADMGKAEGARAIEPLCILWCIPGFLNNDWNHAFKLLKK
jgi:hypothetical protein